MLRGCLTERIPTEILNCQDRKVDSACKQLQQSGPEGWVGVELLVNSYSREAFRYRIDHCQDPFQRFNTVLRELGNSQLWIALSLQASRLLNKPLECI